MEIKLPKSWYDVTIGQWSELQSVDRELTPLSRNIQNISILTDTDPDDIRKLSISDFKTLSSHLSWMNEDLPTEIKSTFIIDGIEFGMIPDLNYITTGEYMDIENLKEDSTGNAHMIAAVLWRRIREKDPLTGLYKIEEHTPDGFIWRSNLFKNKLPITSIWGAVIFFSIGVINSIEIITEYLAKENLM
jgi:hypothetical protein